jgi:hypothetical protein
MTTNSQGPVFMAAKRANQSAPLPTATASFPSLSSLLFDVFFLQKVANQPMVPSLCNTGAFASSSECVPSV